MKSEKNKGGRPTVADKRVRVCFMAFDSKYQKALEKGRDRLQRILELALDGLANEKKSY